MAFHGLRKIGDDLSRELKTAMDEYLADPSSGFKRMRVEQILWDNKIGLLRCAEFTQSQAAADLR